MSAESFSRVGDHEGEWGEVEQVLAALRELYQKVSSPMIRACLEAARDDIAYLAGTGEGDGEAGAVEADDFDEIEGE